MGGGGDNHNWYTDGRHEGRKFLYKGGRGVKVGKCRLIISRNRFNSYRLKSAYTEKRIEFHIFISYTNFEAL